MPVKGPQRWLFEAICSILLQGYADVELVVKDGGHQSPAASEPRVERILGLLGDRVKYKVGPDAGIFHGLNDCLQRATGEILYFMAADDMLCPGALIAVNELFEYERFGGPCWCYGQTISAHESGRTQGIDGNAATLEQMLGHNRIGQPGVFWNRQLLGLVGLFDTRYRFSADYDMWLRFWRRCEPVFLNQTLGIFRHHPGQTTEEHREAVEREARMIAWRHRELGGAVARARNVLTARRAYPDGIPESRN